MARKLLSKPVCNLLQATNLIPFSHNENSLLFCELLHKVFWQFKSASTVTRCIAIGYFSEVSLVRINCMDLLVVSHPYKVSLKGNITKINTNTKDQETVKGTSVGHNNDTSPQSYTLTLVNAKFKGFGTKSNFKVLVFINWRDITYISWKLETGDTPINKYTPINK